MEGESIGDLDHLLEIDDISGRGFQSCAMTNIHGNLSVVNVLVCCLKLSSASIHLLVCMTTAKVCDIMRLTGLEEEHSRKELKLDQFMEFSLPSTMATSPTLVASSQALSSTRTERYLQLSG